jgi:hypothetical protein
MPADRPCPVPFTSTVECVAVVKVPPSVGCVKYKALHVVLPKQIPMFQPCYKLSPRKSPANPCGFLPIAANNAVPGTEHVSFKLELLHNAIPRRCQPIRQTPAHCTRVVPATPPHKAQNWCIRCGHPRKSGKAPPTRAATGPPAEHPPARGHFLATSSAISNVPVLSDDTSFSPTRTKTFPAGRSN